MDRGSGARKSRRRKSGYLSLCLAACLAHAPTAAGQGQGAAGDKPSRPASDRVIISMSDEQRPLVYRLLEKALGKAKGEKLGLSESEVWTVPTNQMKRLALQLRVLGSKLSRLPEDWNHILTRPEQSPATSAAREEIARRSRASPEFVGVGLMKAQDPAIVEYALTVGAELPAAAGSDPPKPATSRIVIPIDDTRQVTIQRVQASSTATGVSWRGIVEESGESAILMWWKGGRMSGLFAHKGRIYSIVNAGENVYAVVESDPGKMPPDHAPVTSDDARARDEGMAETAADERPADIEPLADDARKALEAKQVTIDLMMLYTQRAASRYVHGPRDVLELAIEQANETFRNSGVGNVRLRLVHVAPIDYDESESEKFEHLFRMVDGVGVFKDVRRLRDKVRADVVGLMLENPNGCGLSTRVGADAEEAYFVVHHACAALTISIAHEVGHIMGARHDRSIDRHNKPFPYGHGYVNGAKWRDIMSYHKACEGCPRIPYWSNPRISYQGEPTGTPSEDNARVILEQAERVSKFR
jgi:hypothetical protein